jgi:hypothetical protein
MARGVVLETWPARRHDRDAHRLRRGTSRGQW